MNKLFKCSRTTQAVEQNVQKVHANEQLNIMYKKFIGNEQLNKMFKKSMFKQVTEKKRLL